VLGEYMRDLTEILQIAIVAIARLEKAEISPDIMMVQHLTERNIEKISALRQTIASGKLFHQFRPFKNGASVNSPPSEEYHQDVVDLYNSIIDIAKKSNAITDFNDWQELVHSYWDGVKNENFMRFKDVKELQDFLKRGDLIWKLKESVESAFREHSDGLRGFITEKATLLNKKEIEREIILKLLNDKLKCVPQNCSYDERCERCIKVLENQSELYKFVENKSSETETKIIAQAYIEKTREWFSKQLSQMLSAIAIRQIESADFFNKINEKLKTVLNTKTELTDLDVKKTAMDIWREIEIEAAEHVLLTHSSNQIFQEISEVYAEFSSFTTDFLQNIQSVRNPSAPIKPLISRAIDTVFIMSENSLPNSFYDEMEKDMKNLGYKIMEEENAQGFQTGMVAKLRKKVYEIILLNENHLKFKFTAELKYRIYLFANQKFRDLMEIYQKKWDEENNPLTILRSNKSQYLYMINERLEKGFTLDSDAEIAANCLITAIKFNALKFANRKRIQEVLDIGWLNSCESVRLKCFSELVEQIKSNNFSSVLNHFNDAECQIEIWYINKVNNFSTGNEYKMFDKVMITELNNVLEDIKLHSNIANTRHYIENYISSYDVIKFPEISNVDIDEKTYFDVFRSKIIDRLNQNIQNPPKCTKSDLMLPSYDSIVMDRLGCTYACPICSALCWGQSGHHEDRGDIKKHHTCHQPMGLSGKKFRDTSMLSTEMCHDQKNNTVWFVGDKKSKWHDLMKLEMFKNWRFGRHVNKKFDDLMKWFFLVLNEKTAARYDGKPASEQQLKLLDIDSTVIDQILSEINQKI
jgi:hypothetical protein